jgi:hypothetical protein
MEPNQKKTTHLNSVSDNRKPDTDTPIQGQYELILNWYKLNGKNLLDEEVLSGLPVKTLLKVLGNPIWNEIYHCWAIETKHMPNLQSYIEHQFDPDKFSYFIEVYHNT